MKSVALLLVGVTQATLMAQISRPTVQVDSQQVNAVRAMGVDADRGTAAMLWEWNAVGNFDESIWFSRSVDNGLNWSPRQRVNHAGNLVFTGPRRDAMRMTVHRNHIYGVWAEDVSPGGGTAKEPVFLRSTDWGATLETTVLDSGSNPGVFVLWSIEMAVAKQSFGAGSDRVHVLMRKAGDFGDRDLLLTSSRDGGATFGSAIEIPLEDARVGQEAVCAIGETVHVFWTDNRNANFPIGEDLFHRKSNDGGVTFGPETIIEPGTSTRNFSALSVACEGDLVAVAWGDENGNGNTNRLRLSVSNDGGDSFPDFQMVNQGFGLLEDHQVRVSKGRVLVVWEDSRDGTDHVYAAQSEDQGMTFRPNERLSQLTGKDPIVSFDAPWQVLFVEANEHAVARHTTDLGATFAPPITVGDDGLSNQGFNSLNRVAVDQFNRNVITSLHPRNGGTKELLAGGYSVCHAATVTDLQMGTNADVYQADPMVIGSSDWGCSVDLSGTVHPLVAIFGSLGKASDPVGSQYMFVDLSSPLFFHTPFLAGPTALYSMPIPNDPSLCGVTIYSQAFLVGGGKPATLSNGQAMRIGAFVQ